MRIQKRSGRVFSLVIILCAFLIAWGVAVRSRPGSVVQAQADNWTTPTAQRMGIRLLETHDPSGPPAYPVEAGDLLFFTNAGTSGSQNVTNSVVVINAKTKKPIAISELNSIYTDKYTSHSIGVSPDGKYIYLPSLLSIRGPEGKIPNTLLVLDSRSLKLHQVLASGGPPHHVKVFRDWTGKSRVLVEDWTWSMPEMNGKGIPSFLESYFVRFSIHQQRERVLIRPNGIYSKPFPHQCQRVFTISFFNLNRYCFPFPQDDKLHDCFQESERQAPAREAEDGVLTVIEFKDSNSQIAAARKAISCKGCGLAASIVLKISSMNEVVTFPSRKSGWCMIR